MRNWIQAKGGIEGEKFVKKTSEQKATAVQKIHSVVAEIHIHLVIIHSP